MKFSVYVLLLVLLATTVLAQQTFVVGIEANGNSLLIDEVIVGQSQEVKLQENGFYAVQVRNERNRLLYESRFDTPGEISYSPLPPGSFDENGKQIFFPDTPYAQGTEEELSYLHITLPYHQDAFLLELRDSDDIVLDSIGIAHLVDNCGDSICQPHESYDSCPADCTSGGEDDYCDGEIDNICDPDCAFTSQDADCAAPIGVIGPPIIEIVLTAILGLTSITIISLMIIRFRNRNRPNPIVNSQYPPGGNI